MNFRNIKSVEDLVKKAQEPELEPEPSMEREEKTFTAIVIVKISGKDMDEARNNLMNTLNNVHSDSTVFDATIHSIDED